MQVSHKDDHITHAVIAKAKPIEMRMAQTPEFFQVLFKSLYKYPLLACVRETLCNAWDAHIEAGLTDKPIELHLDHETFSIRDFGKGIPDENMEEIYCVFGQSTKAANEEVTGGFGLGCKAPFAIADHFDVISMNQGKKTIYNLSRSSDAVDGVPACLPIVTVPTTESGLQVKIPINLQMRETEAYIKRVVFGGGIKAILNGEELKTIPLGSEAGDWVISRMPVLGYDDRHRNCAIYIRYGNVVYPGTDLEQHLPAQYRETMQFLDRLYRFLGNRNDFGVKLVLQSRPGSLSVTPSRETLSMVPKTVEEIKQLLAVVHTKLIQDTVPVAFEAVKETVKAAVESRDYRALTCVHHVPPHADAASSNANGYYGTHEINSGQADRTLGLNMTSVAALGKALIRHPHYYKEVRKLHITDLRQRVRLMIENGLLDRGTLQTFEKLLTPRVPHIGSGSLDRWFRRVIVGRLITAMLKNPKLDHTKLFVPKEHPYHDKGELLPAMKWSNVRGGELHNMVFLRKIVLLAPNKEVMLHNLDNIPDSKKLGGISERCLGYITGRNPEHIEAAKALFERHGYVIIDMTVMRSWMQLPPRYEIELNKPPKVRKPPSPPKKGLVPLSALLDREHGDYKLRAVKSTDGTKERVRSPKGVLQLDRESYGDRRFRLKGFGHDASIHAAKLYGDHIGVVVNSESLKVQMEKKGFARGERYILDQIIEEMTNNPNIQSYLPFFTEGVHEYEMLKHCDGDDLVKAIMLHKPAKKLLGLNFVMNPIDWLHLDMWHKLINQRNYNFEDFYPELKRCPIKPLEVKIKAIPMAQAMKDLLEWVNTDNSWKMLEPERILSQLRLNPTTDSGKAEQKLAGQLLMAVLKGK